MQLPPVHFDHAVDDAIEEVSVVGHQHQRHLAADQPVLDPVDHLGIEVIGGFVEQQQVRAAEQQLGQRHAATFTPRQVCAPRVRIDETQPVDRRQHLVLDVVPAVRLELLLETSLATHELVEMIGIGGRRHLLVDRIERGLNAAVICQRLADRVADRRLRIENRLLIQHADRQPATHGTVAGIGLLGPGKDPHQGRLARAVPSDQRDPIRFAHQEIHAAQQRLVAVGLGDVGEAQ